MTRFHRALRLLLAGACICLGLLGQAGLASAQEKKEKPARKDPPRVVVPAKEDKKAQDEEKKETAKTDTKAAADAAEKDTDAADHTGEVGGAPGFIGPVPPDREEPAQAGNVADSAKPGKMLLPRPGVDTNAPPLNIPPERSATSATTGGLSGTAPPGGTGGAASTVPALPGVPEHGLSFPEFAEGQPGFVPGQKAPGDLFAPAPATDLSFTTQLGASKLPTQDTQGLISSQAGNPGADLPQNFARVVVPTGTIEGSTETKQFHIEGGLLIYYSEIVVQGDTADIDEKSEIAIIKGNVTITDPRYTLKTDELRILFKEKRFEATGFVQFKKNADPKKLEPDMSLPKKDRVREYFAGQQFELYCSKLFYNWESKEMTALTGVRLVHPSFTGTLERMDYNDKTKEYAMSEKVQLEITNYDWMFKTQMVEEKDEKKMKALTEGSTKVSCDRMLYSEETGVAKFYALTGGEVSFEQPKRSVKGSYIEVNDKTKDFYAEGVEGKPAVYTQTDGAWLYDAEILKKETTPADVQHTLEGTLTTKSGTITYNYDRKRLEMLGGVSIEGTGSNITAGELIEDETAKFFLLRQNVLIQPNSDSEVRAAQVYIDTENDVITFVGLVQGKTKSDDLPSTAPEGAAGAAAAGAGQGGAAGGQSGVQAGVFSQGALPPGQGGNGTFRGTSNTNIAEKK